MKAFSFQKTRSGKKDEEDIPLLRKRRKSPSLKTGCCAGHWEAILHLLLIYQKTTLITLQTRRNFYTRSLSIHLHSVDGLVHQSGTVPDLLVKSSIKNYTKIIENKINFCSWISIVGQLFGIESHSVRWLQYTRTDLKSSTKNVQFPFLTSLLLLANYSFYFL